MISSSTESTSTRLTSVKLNEQTTKTSQNDRIQNDQVVNETATLIPVITHINTTTATTKEAATEKEKSRVISDVSHVYSHVISGDMNLDILPLEQDMSDPDSHYQSTYIQ